MSTPSIAKSRNVRPPHPRRRAFNRVRQRGARSRPLRPPPRCPPKSDEPKVARVTKQERLLTLLDEADGASIEEMMQATDWQQHSVRGFLAGTVKKKLGSR